MSADPQPSRQELTDHLVDVWDLELEPTARRYGDWNEIRFARRDGHPCVLKIGGDGHDVANEAIALTAWDGDGAVRLLESTDGALLLERLEPDRTLDDLPIGRAVEQFAALIGRLDIPAPDGLPLLVDHARAVASLDMGPHPLWQLESLLERIPVPAGSSVLDLGCGKGATSVFLAREFGARVTAVDHWIDAATIAEVAKEAGVGDLVTAVSADARHLDLDPEQFDVVVSIDAFEYFGTDVHFLPGLLRLLRPGAALGISTPALRIDPYDQDPPQYVTKVVGWEAAAWHSPQWWARHWQLTGGVTDVVADLQPHGRDDWIAWCDIIGEDPHGPVPCMLKADTDELISFARVTARKI